MSGLEGRVALVTGGARGQGRAHALALARAGADVAICDVGGGDDPAAPYELASLDELEQTAEEIRRIGRRCLAQAADVTEYGQLEGFAAETMAHLGRIDAVVANAGIGARPCPSWQIREDEWDRVLAVNLKGVWLTCKTTIPRLLESGGGSIVIVSSIGGLRGQPGLGAYVASKHGVVGYMRTLANEVGPLGIRVNAVCPGAVETQMVTNQTIMDVFSGAEPGQGSRDGLAAALQSRVLLSPGLLSPDDVAHSVVWLVSDDSRWITGAVIPVDAGMAAKTG